jgi:hypothetical protein
MCSRREGAAHFSILFAIKTADLPVQKYFEKSEKKACQALRGLINGNLRRQISRVIRSKIFEKSEKKACQPLKNSIIPA